jgi:RNA polymerase sigma-70 factor (ECF subfamily)
LLIQRHQSRLRLYLRSLCGNNAFADELAQETLLKVHRSLSQFKFESSYKTWLMTVARNTFLDQARLASYTHNIAIRTPAEEQGLEKADESASSSENMQIFTIDLNKAMKSLSQAEREVIAHCYFADLSMDETARVLNMPLGTVKTHSNRALMKLRSELQAWKINDSH